MTASDLPAAPGEPRRIQRKRTKGWRMPDGAVYVGRPTKWGNPFRAGWGITEAVMDAVTAFRAAAEAGGIPDPAELRGKDLACFCPLDQPCHADVLLELANASPPDLRLPGESGETE